MQYHGMDRPFFGHTTQTSSSDRRYRACSKPCRRSAETIAARISGAFTTPPHSDTVRVLDGGWREVTPGSWPNRVPGRLALEAAIGSSTLAATEILLGAPIRPR